MHDLSHYRGADIPGKPELSPTINPTLYSGAAPISAMIKVIRELQVAGRGAAEEVFSARAAKAAISAYSISFALLVSGRALNI